MKPIAILGAGLSGLACATTLFRAGKKVVVLEEREKVGGRVSTEKSSEGFLFDEGFQVLLSSYPELSHFVDLKTLNLQTFNSGALIFNGQKLELLANPFRHPKDMLSTLAFSGATLKDKVLLVKLMGMVLATKPQDEWAGSTTLDYLRSFGFSETFIELFWRPFLGGVYLDPTLSVDSGFFKFLMNCFAWGEVTLPEQGMSALPEAIAKVLPPDCVKLNQKVKEFSEKEVVLENGEVLECSQVVCAFDKEAKKKIYRRATTDYFTFSQESFDPWKKWLILVPPKYGMKISHLALISSVAPQYSPKGAPLLSVTQVGDSQGEVKDLIQELQQIAGKKFLLHHLCKKEIPLALPVIERRAEGFELKGGVIFCGDRFVSPSINGALKSGRMAAEKTLATRY